MENNSALRKINISNSLVDRLHAQARLLLILLWIITISVLFSGCSNLPLDLLTNVTENPTPTNVKPTEVPSATSIPSSPSPIFQEPSPTKTQTPTLTDVPLVNTPTAADNVVLKTPDPITTRTTVFDETSDLIFLSEGDLMRWDHVTNFSSVLVENVLDFSISEGTNQIAVLKRTNISENGKELYDLAVLDFDTKQLHYLLEKTPRLYEISISPDGKWVAYKDEPEDGSITAFHIDDSNHPYELGTCRNNETAKCDQLEWSPGSGELLWSDVDGVWMADFEDISTRQVYSNTIQVADPDGGEEQIDVTFNSFVWSPIGRFVLVDIVPSNYGVRWQAVLDTGSGRIVQVPETYDYSNLDACATWTESGSLLVGHSGGVLDPPLPYIDLWNVIPTSHEMLLLEKKIDFDANIFPTMPNQDDLEINYFPNWVTQVDENNFTFGLCQVESDTSPILYQLDITNGDVNEIIVIPYNSMDILWAPDGSGALILGKNKEVIYAPFDGSLMRDLRKLFGEDAFGFTWLPPTPRT